jgi:hypothetical protein
MNKIYTNSLYILLLCFMLSLLSGCYAITNLQKDQPNSGYIISNQKNLPPACLVTITASINGAGQNVATTFPQRVIGKLQESKIFSNVESILNGGKRPQEPFYELILTVNEKPYANTFITFVEGFFIGASFFILTPVLPLTSEFGSDMTLKVIAPNMKEKEYRVSQNGSLVCTYFNCASGRAKLVGEVTDNDIICLINQMVQDEWISANSK